jgi:MFS family permease
MKPGMAKPPFFYGYVIIAAAFLIIYGAEYSFGVFFKPILQEFGWSRAEVSGAYSLSWLVMGFASVVMGKLNDRFGPRLVLSICGVISGAGFMLMSGVNTVWQMYLFYGIIVGSGISIWVPLMSTVARWFIKNRTSMSGIVGAGIGIGMLIGSPIINGLISLFDWRSAYIILGGVVLVAVTGGAQLLRRDPAQKGLEAYGATAISGGKAASTIQSISLKQAISTRQFWLILAMFLCFGLCFQGILPHIAAHITDLGASPASAALSIAVIGGASIVSKVALGALGDRIGNRNATLLSFAIMLAALIWLFPSTELWQFYLFAAVFGFAYGGMVAQQSPLIGAIFGLASHGVIFSMVGLGASIGSAIGPVMSGFIFDITGNYQAAFAVISVICSAGIILTLLINTNLANKAHITH